MDCCDAFVRHQAEYNCVNYQKKAYKTRCTCLNAFLDGLNSNETVFQVCDSLWEFFTRVKSAQKLVFKEWLRSVLYSGNDYKRGESTVAYVLPGFYYDAPAGNDMAVDKNKRPYKVCLNALSVLYNYGYHKINKLRKDMEKIMVKEHGLKGKPNNKHTNKKEMYESINAVLNKFFKDLEG